MTRFIVSFALLACLAGCVDGANPFDEDEATDTSSTDTTDTGTDSSDTDSSDTDADTETSETGTMMTKSYHWAQKIIKRHVNANDDDILIRIAHRKASYSF